MNKGALYNDLLVTEESCDAAAFDIKVQVCDCFFEACRSAEILAQVLN